MSLILQREVHPAGLRHVLYKNPLLTEEQIVIRNTDKEIRKLDPDGRPIMSFGEVEMYSPDPAYYQQMDWQTVLNMRSHLITQRSPLVFLYYEPGGRTIRAVSNAWTAGLERYDRNWPHGILVVGFDDSLEIEDMNIYTLNKPRVTGEPLERQTTFLPKRGAFIIRDSYSNETTAMSYAKVLCLGMYAEGLIKVP